MEMLKLYPLIQEALNENQLEKSLKDLMPSETNDEKEEEKEEEEEEQQEEINFDQFLSWVESLYLKAKRYVLSFHFVLLV
tara:strand:- start:212 stop:451 length:240 start_codon:yes stop_codon:yes gene_type:complete